MQMMPLSEGIELKEIANVHFPISIVFLVIALVYKFGFKKLGQKLAFKLKLINPKSGYNYSRRSSYK